MVAQGGQWRQQRRCRTLPATTTVPATLKVAGTFLIRVDSNLAYAPIINWQSDTKQKLGLTPSLTTTISMGETYYLRPRRSLTIPCSDC